MNKLLRVNLKLMVRRNDTRLCIALSVILAVLGALVSKLNGNMTWYDMFEFPLILVMIFSAVGGLFISRDYTQNTIRNKLTVGHKRTDIYLANQITETIFFCVPVIFYFITSAIANFILIGAKGAVFSEVMGNIAVCLIAVNALSALTTFLAMTVKSSAGGVLPIILMYPMLMLSVLAEALEDVKWLKYVCDFIPVSHIASLMQPDKDPALHICCSLVFFALFAAGGIAAFRKADLK